MSVALVGIDPSISCLFAIVRGRMGWEAAMRIALFGATGRLGREVLNSALGRGHCVTAHARKPRQEAQRGVDWVAGEAGDAVAGADVVIVTFGQRSPSDVPFCAAETQAILDGMGRLQVNRILCVTGAMIGHYPGNRSWWFEKLAGRLQRRYRASMDDRARQEELVRQSGLQWTIFKPPRLTLGPPGGKLDAGPKVKVGLLSAVARSSLAHLMVEEAEQGRFVGCSVFIRG